MEKIKIKPSALVFFSAAFTIWQMGIVYFSGTSLSLFGRVPVQTDQQITTGLIATGYLLSILIMSLFPRHMVVIERFMFFVAVVATAGTFLPVPSHTMSAFFYATIFCCVFSIGGLASIATQLFSLETAWTDGIIGIACSGVVIALLQNDFVRFDFTVFMVLSLVLILGLLIFHLKLPAKITVEYAAKKSSQIKPIIPYTGLFLLILFPTMLLLMASSIAETVTNGVSIMYGCAAIFAVLLNLIKKTLGARSIKVYSIFFMLTPLGFVCTILQGHVPAMGFAACVFFAFSVVLSSMYLFFLASAFNLYPSRFVAVQGTAIGFFLAMAHSLVLEVFRSNIFALYCIYLFLSVLLMVIYYLLEPYFMYSWKKNMDGNGDGKENKAKPDIPSLINLSIQEQNLAYHILEGLSESEIAKEMNISLNTQKSYRKNLYIKLNIHSKRELFKLIKD